VEFLRIAVAEVDQKVGFPAIFSKENLIGFAVVETGHWAAVQSQCTGGHDQPGSLQGAVAEGGALGQLFIVGKQFLSSRKMRKEFRHVTVEGRVVGDDNGDWCSQGFVAVALCQCR